MAALSQVRLISSIFDEENGNCVATDMQDEGVIWMRADKRPGSRKQGWEQFRKMMKGSLGAVRQGKIQACSSSKADASSSNALFRSSHGMRRIFDDVDTDAEDHIADEARYVIRGPVEGDSGVW